MHPANPEGPLPRWLRWSIYLTVVPFAWYLFGLPQSKIAGAVCCLICVPIWVYSLLKSRGYSAFCLSLEIVLVGLGLLVVGWAKWAPIPTYEVLDPERASLRFASMRTEMRCRNGKTQDVPLDDPGIFECHVVSHDEIADYGPPPIPPWFGMKVVIRLENHYLGKDETDQLFRQHAAGFGAIELDNPLQGMGSERFEFKTISSFYMKDFIEEWKRSAELILVMSRAWYKDFKGPLFTEQCFYLYPKDFDFSRITKCEGHNKTFSRQPLYWGTPVR